MEVILLLVVVLGLVRFFGRGKQSSEPRPEVGPLGWVDGTKWATARPLARVETRRFIRHPAFISGIVITPWMLTLATFDVDSWRDASGSIALALVPLGWLTIVATHLLTTRPSRTGADALLASLPTPQPVRTAGLLATASAAVLAATVLAVGDVLYLQNQTAPIRGAVEWTEIGAGFLIVAGSAAVGVAVGRFFPHPAFGVLGAVACAFIQVRFFEITSWPWNQPEASPYRFLGFLAPPTSVEPALEIRRAGWHLVYLFALVVLMAGVALSRDGLRRPLSALLGAAVVTAGVAGWAQTRPATDAQVTRMVAYLHDAQARQQCATDGAARFCWFADERPLMAGRKQRVKAVLALLPAAAKPDTRKLEVTSRPPTVTGNSSCSPQPYGAGLLPAVAARMDPDRIWPHDGSIRPGTDNFPCGGRSVHGLFLAVQTGAWAVGLPASPHGRDQRCVADRQARSVVALWLGAAASPDGARSLGQIVGEESAGHLRFADWDEPPMWGVTFAKADAVMALSMLELPRSDVSKALEENWSHIVDPATSASALGSILGVGAS
ncbi:MAG TPA: hypothetical protein VNB24_06940, partial [Acidimicrobiales bacterium]|nr:hypothetical protein [Acidimicrobiales bacterium]